MADRDIPEEGKGALPGEPVETKPFRARPRNDFLTAVDVTAILRFANVERNRGDRAAANQILVQLYRSAVKTWGVGHRQLAPIAAEMSRWNVRGASGSANTGAVRDIPEEMVEKAVVALVQCSESRTGVSVDDLSDASRSELRDLYRNEVLVVLAAALAGSQVVDLPDADEKLDDQDAPQWQVDGVDGAVEAHPETAEVDFAYWTWPVDTARAFAAAILAAVDLAAGSGSGED